MPYRNFSRGRPTPGQWPRGIHARVSGTEPRTAALLIVCLSSSAAISPAPAAQSLPPIQVGRMQDAKAPHRGATSGPQTNGRTSRTPDQPPEPLRPQSAAATPAFIKRFDIPGAVSGITRKQAQTQINIVDTEDALKYLPSLAVRKRFSGDTQAPLQTRTWGYNSPARSLVYVDDLLISNPISNETLTGAPRWGLVSPEEVERVDFIYGPYAAQYPGNSMGGVLQITTRMPSKLEISARNTTSVQDFSLYGDKRGFTKNITNFFIGDRMNAFSWSLSGNWLTGAQPPQLLITTLPGNLYPYPGAYPQFNRFGLPVQIIGSAGSIAGDQISGKFKAAYDISNSVRATYTVGLWSNNGTSKPENFLTLGNLPFFGSAPFPTPPALGPAALITFGGGYFQLQEKMLANAAAIKSTSGGVFDYELSASNFSVLQFDQTSPFSAAYPYGGYTATGRDLRFGGTYWTLVDLKGILRPTSEALRDHSLSFGFHGDHVHVTNPVYLTTDWASGMSSSYGVTATRSSGTTRTQALWIQDAWLIAPETKFTAGLRGELWKGSDGLTQSIGNINAAGLPVNLNLKALSPTYHAATEYARLSPKASLDHRVTDNWSISANMGMANRFPTPRELYGLNSAATSGYDVIPNPTLLPEVALTKELVVRRNLEGDGNLRASIFDEEVRDAMIAQTVPIQGTTQLTLTAKNIDRVRNSGVEIAVDKQNAFIDRLDMSASATWVKSRVVSYAGWAPSIPWPTSASALLRNPGNMDFWCASVAGKNLPYLPEWRATLAATYRPNDSLALTFGARYQSHMWSTFANNDYVQNTYQALGAFFVADVKARVRLSDSTALELGVDNIGNYKYFLVNPMPQRTFYFALSHEIGSN